MWYLQTIYPQLVFWTYLPHPEVPNWRPFSGTRIPPHCNEVVHFALWSAHQDQLQVLFKPSQPDWKDPDWIQPHPHVVNRSNGWVKNSKLHVAPFHLCSSGENVNPHNTLAMVISIREVPKNEQKIQIHEKGCISTERKGDEKGRWWG